MAMFPFKHSDGQWYDSPESRPQHAIQPKRQWTPTGFFKHRRMSRHEVAMKASNARMWLETLLFDGPLPATEVLHLAKLEGFSEWGIRRAKKHLRIRTIKTGGRYRGYGAQWIWQFPIP